MLPECLNLDALKKFKALRHVPKYRCSFLTTRGVFIPPCPPYSWADGILSVFEEETAF